MRRRLSLDVRRVARSERENHLDTSIPQRLGPDQLIGVSLREQRRGRDAGSSVVEHNAALYGQHLPEGHFRSGPNRRQAKSEIIELRPGPRSDSHLSAAQFPWLESTRGELRGASPRGRPSGGLNGGHGCYIEESLTTRLAARVPQLLYESPPRERAVFHHLSEGPTPTRGAWQRGEANRPPMAGPIHRSSALRR